MLLSAFETERLWLRPFTMDDVEPSYEMNLDSEVSRYTGDGGIQSLETIRERIQEDVLGDYARFGYGRFAVVHKKDQRFIGFSGLKYLERYKSVDIGYRLMRDYWGKGLATEASKPFIDMGFEQLNLNRIIGLVLPENKASVKVLKKLGLQYSHLIEEEGEFADLYEIDRLRFEKQKVG